MSHGTACSWPNSKRVAFLEDVRWSDESIRALETKHGIPHDTGWRWAKAVGLLRGRKFVRDDNKGAA